MKQRVAVVVKGLTIVGLYATLLAVQALVLDPLAAAPGHSLPEIHTRLTRDGMNVTADTVSVIATAAIGVACAVLTASFGLRFRFPPVVLAAVFLCLIAFGAFATFGSGFALGMDVADVYGTGGQPHTIWAGVLYLTSLIALFGVFVLIVARGVRSRPGTVPSSPRQAT